MRKTAHDRTDNLDEYDWAYFELMTGESYQIVQNAIGDDDLRCDFLKILFDWARTLSVEDLAHLIEKNVAHYPSKNPISSAIFKRLKCLPPGRIIKGACKVLGVNEDTIREDIATYVSDRDKW